MINSDFKGAARRIDDVDIPMIGHRIAVGEDEVHALMDVEARNSGFDDQGRPAMLYEPHLFYRYLPQHKRDQAVKAGLAYPNWKPGNYPRDSYPRLKEAMAIDEEAALKACSWGMGQILGSNHLDAGYRSPQLMVAAFMEDEEEHLEAMIRFIINAGIADDLKAHRWSTVARVYNGPGYAKHGYHTRLEAAYKKWAGIKDTPWSPDAPDAQPQNGEELKAVQTRLRALGYTEVGNPDGKWGTKTRAGVLAFRADNGLPIYVGIDQEFKAALISAKPRDIAPERREATVDDLRRGGSKTIKTTDNAKAGAAVVTGVGTVGIGLQAIESISSQLDTAQGLLAKIEPLKETMLSMGPWVLGAVGLYIVWQVWGAQNARVDDHRTGKNAGPDAHAKIEVAR